MKLYYYSARLRDKDPAVQAENLARADRRLRELKPQYAERGIHLWAPWIDMAIVGMGEEAAWELIEQCVRRSEGILLDRQGRELSEGMKDEDFVAQLYDKEVEVLP